MREIADANSSACILEGQDRILRAGLRPFIDPVYSTFQFRCLIRFHKFDFEVAICLATAWTHLKPVAYLAFYLLQRLGPRRSRYSDRADPLAGMFHFPVTSFLGNSAREPHALNNNGLTGAVYFCL